MGNCVTLIRLQIPEVIRAAEMAYCSNLGQKGEPQIAKRKTTRGGVIKPPTIAKACCSPMTRAKRKGIGSSGCSHRTTNVSSLDVNSLPPDQPLESHQSPQELTFSIEVQRRFGPTCTGDLWHAHGPVVILLTVAD